MAGSAVGSFSVGSAPAATIMEETECRLTTEEVECLMKGRVRAARAALAEQRRRIEEEAQYRGEEHRRRAAVKHERARVDREAARGRRALAAEEVDDLDLKRLPREKANELFDQVKRRIYSKIGLPVEQGAEACTFKLHAQRVSSPSRQVPEGNASECLDQDGMEGIDRRRDEHKNPSMLSQPETFATPMDVALAHQWHQSNQVEVEIERGEDNVFSCERHESPPFHSTDMGRSLDYVEMAGGVAPTTAFGASTG